MFTAARRKQVTATFKPTLEPLESRVQPSSLSNGSMISALGAEASVVVNQIQTAVQGIPQAVQSFVQSIEQKTENIISTLKSPQTRAGMDMVLMAAGSGMAVAAPSVPLPNNLNYIMVPLGYAIEAAAAYDLNHLLSQQATHQLMSPGSETGNAAPGLINVENAPGLVNDPNAPRN